MITRLSALLALFLLTLPLGALAQDSNQSLKGYTPPPMFGAPRAVPPKKAQPKAPKMPALSQPTSLDPTPRKNTTPVIKPSTPALAPKSKAPAIPLQKPEHPKVKFEAKKTIEKPKTKIKSGLEPIDLLPKTQQIQKPKSEGIVKGPKTMPSHKKQSVETEVLFEDGQNEQVNLIDRAQKKEEVKKSTPIAPLPNPSFKLPSFNILADGSRKLNILFTETQEDLAPEQINTLEQLILPLLKEKETTRLRLESFASPQTDSISGDRRLALSRVMAVRQYIIDQNITPNRLDVRSLGAQTDIQPMDRIEIFIAQ